MKAKGAAEPDAVADDERTDRRLVGEEVEAPEPEPFERRGHDGPVEEEPVDRQRRDHRRDDHRQQSDEDRGPPQGLGEPVDAEREREAQDQDRGRRHRRVEQRELQRRPEVDVHRLAPGRAQRQPARHCLAQPVDLGCVADVVGADVAGDALGAAVLADHGLGDGAHDLAGHAAEERHLGLHLGELGAHEGLMDGEPHDADERQRDQERHRRHRGRDEGEEGTALHGAPRADAGRGRLGVILSGAPDRAPPRGRRRPRRRATSRRFRGRRGNPRCCRRGRRARSRPGGSSDRAARPPSRCR